MAKKNQSLSPEKMLQNALVPDWERPYKVPENWTWVLGTAIFLSTESKKPVGDKFVYIDIDSIDNHNQCVKEPKILDVSKAPSRANRGLKQGDTLFSLVRPYLRNIAFVEEEYKNAIASTGFYICRPNNINARFLYWLMCSGYVVDGLNRFMKGDNSPSIRKDDIERFFYPLPPLAEQGRIVNSIASLFSKLDEAKEKAQTALESYENRKAAIMHKAFTGELTKKWREENGVNLDSWENKFFQEVAMIKSNLVNPAEYLNYSHIAPDNIVKKTGKLLSYNTIAEDGVTSVKHRFYSGQILYSKIRPYLSKVVIANFDGLCSADMYPIEAKEDTKYLWYYMLTKSFVDQASNAGSRSVLPKINQKELSGLTVTMCSIKEQTKIVLILDSIFEKEQKAKELSDVIEKIDLMKKAILGRAFRGELGTNDPEEESAKELLKSILVDKIKTVPSIKGKDKAKKNESVLILEGFNVPKTILEALSVYNRLTPEKLKAQTSIKDIDEFYAELKNLVDTGAVIEHREGDESYLEVNNADR